MDSKNCRIEVGDSLAEISNYTIANVFYDANSLTNLTDNITDNEVKGQIKNQINKLKNNYDAGNKQQVKTEQFIDNLTDTEANFLFNMDNKGKMYVCVCFFQSFEYSS